MCLYPVDEHRNGNQTLTFKDLDKVVYVPLVGDNMFSIQENGYARSITGGQ
jgi:hypothetical protein